MPETPSSWFDEEVEAYERTRPSYPDEAFAEFVSFLREGGLAAPFDVLEIGPGTGKATASLIAGGMRVTAVEPGANMTAFLRKKFAGKPLDVMHARFEDAALRDASFDAVLSATSFGWVDEAVRLVKSHRVLRDGGALAVLDTMQIASDVDRGFFERCFPIYVKHRPDEQRSVQQTEHEVTPPVLKQLRENRLFSDVRLYRYRWDRTYPTAQYADLVRSYSNTQMMPREQREALISDLCTLIDAEFDGYVVRPLVITLALGRNR